MSDPQVIPISVDPIAEDIRTLEIGIRRLKIEYDQFFAGGRKREPLLLLGQLKKIIKRYNETPITVYGQRFHFSSLLARFNILSELWRKQARKHEEGDRRFSARPKAERERVLARCRIKDPDRQRPAVRQLYGQYLEALSGSGGKKPTPTFKKFARSVEAQARRLQKSSGCAEIELRLLLHDGKVQLRARPRK